MTAPQLSVTARRILMDLGARQAAGRQAPTPTAIRFALGVSPGDSVISDRLHAALYALKDRQLIEVQGEGRVRRVALTTAGLAQATTLLEAAGSNGPRYTKMTLRSCMKCGKTFESEGPGHRLCEEHRKRSLHPFDNGYAVAGGLS